MTPSASLPWSDTAAHVAGQLRSLADQLAATSDEGLNLMQSMTRAQAISLITGIADNLTRFADIQFTAEDEARWIAITERAKREVGDEEL